MTQASWNASELARVVGLVAERAGLNATSATRSSVEAGIRRAAGRVGARDAAQLVRRVHEDPRAMDALLAEVTIGETYFLREPAQFDFLRREVAPRLACRGGPVRAWSAGCATGEEAYSLAIALREGGAGEQLDVVGTDVARARVERARRGRYGEWSLRGVPDPVVDRYFRRVGRQFELREEVRTGVQFRVLNLVEDEYPSTASGIWQMDVVLCRNVLIYLQPAAVRRVARRLLASLSPEGWLFLGASDPPISELVRCQVIATEGGLAYRRAPPGARPVRAPRPPAAAPPPAAAAKVPPSPPAPRPAAPRAPAPADPPPAPAPDPQREAVAAVRRLADQGRLAEAGRACAAALDRFRTSAELAHLHALLLTEAGASAEAVRAARRALYLDRGLAAGHVTLGLALARAGDPAGARHALRTAGDLLAALAPEAVVPASGGERAATLRQLVRTQLRLLGEGAA